MTLKATSWNERFALIDHYQPTDYQITNTFGIPQSELDTARSLRTSGMIASSKTFDSESYGDPFNGEVSVTDTTTTVKPKATKTMTKTSTPIHTDSTPSAETATRKVLLPKKRGRKGTKIDEAFRAIPEAPTPVDEFSKQYGVSVPVLRQSKRFDKSGELGLVKVKVNRDNGVLEIWRDKTAS